MSKNHKPKQQERSAPVNEATDAIVEEKAVNVPKHRQCPSCYEGKGGVGQRGWWRRINGALVKRQYKCNKCDMDWTIEERTHSVIEKIEYSTVTVEHRVPDIQTR